MSVQYLDVDVNTAARQRIHRLFDDFVNVLVAFSGGKDSGVCVNLAVEVARERGQLDRLAVYHLDYEAGYTLTVDYVRRVFDALPAQVRAHWLCVPMRAGCAVSMHQTYWVPWDPDARDRWVRDFPDHPALVTGGPWWRPDAVDYDLQEDYCRWFAAEHGATAVIVGIRAGESLHRRAVITSKQRAHMHDSLAWTKAITESTVNAYPIYDWTTDDIWTANARFAWDYNHLYDLLYQAGMPVESMRVSSPFHAQATESLKLYRVIEPGMWARMLGRVNGVNFTGIYGGTTAMGWKSITKPDHFTWREYFEFLVSTLPDETRAKIEAKVRKSRFAWATTGEARSEEFIAALEDEGARPIRAGKSNRTKANPDHEVIRLEDYLDDTGLDDFASVPTWKRACICIMKNDYAGLYMGFARTKTELEARRRAIELWEDQL